jgi:hypothetical protein
VQIKLLGIEPETKPSNPTIVLSSEDLAKLMKDGELQVSFNLKNGDAKKSAKVVDRVEAKNLIEAALAARNDLEIE